MTTLVTLPVITLDKTVPFVPFGQYGRHDLFLRALPWMQPCALRNMLLLEMRRPGFQLPVPEPLLRRWLEGIKDYSNQTDRDVIKRLLRLAGGTIAASSVFVPVTCHTCGGTGFILPSHGTHRCWRCRGTKIDPHMQIDVEAVMKAVPTM